MGHKATGQKHPGVHEDDCEQVSAAWFGPKGFASVVYGLLVLQSSIHDANRIYTLPVVTVALSMVLHSSSDIVVAR